MKKENAPDPGRREVLRSAAKLPYVVPLVLAAVQARAQRAPASPPPPPPP